MCAVWVAVLGPVAQHLQDAFEVQSLGCVAWKPIEAVKVSWEVDRSGQLAVSAL